MKTCVACNHSIDDQARLCPYCGADPATGEKVDTQAVLDQVFHTKRLSATDTVIDYARRRQGIVIAVVAILALLVLGALYQFITTRNSAVTAGAAISLSEIADAANEKDEAPQTPMPEMRYQMEGRAQAMRTFIAEPGAIAPPAPMPQAAQPQPARAVPPRARRR